MASQGVAMAMGMQDRFSWGQVGLSAFSAAATAGLAGASNTSSLSAFAGKGLGETVARTMAVNAMTQGVAMVTGLQKSFNWTSVAASGAAAGASGWMAEGLGWSSENPVASVGYGTLRGLVSGGIQSQLTGQRPNWSAIAAESFGSALGDQVVSGIQNQDRARQQQKAAFAKQVRDWGFSGRAEALEPAWLSLDSLSNEAAYAVVDDEPVAQRATAGKAAVTGGNAILPNGERINGRYIGDEADGAATFVLDTVGVTAERPRHLDEGAWAAFQRGYNGGGLGVMEDNPWSWAGEYGSRATNSFKNLFESMTGYSSMQLARSQYAKENYISAAGYTMAAVGEAAQTFLMFGAPVGGMVGTLERGAVARHGKMVPNSTVLLQEPGVVENLLYGARVGEGLPGSSGVVIGGRPTVEQILNLSEKHGVEFSTVYTLGPGKSGSGGYYTLYSGGPSSVSVGEFGADKILINHTHPKGTASASGYWFDPVRNVEVYAPDPSLIQTGAVELRGDWGVLQGFINAGSPQRSSVVIPGARLDGNVLPPFRFDVTSKNLDYTVVNGIAIPKKR